MPRCFKCNKQQDVLKSWPIPGQTMGAALCDKCFTEAKEEKGKGADKK